MLERNPQRERQIAHARTHEAIERQWQRTGHDPLGHLRNVVEAGDRAVLSTFYTSERSYTSLAGFLVRSDLVDLGRALHKREGNADAT